MLELENRAEVMVIYGYGGIGKTTLATAVVANLNPKAKGFNYARINLAQDPQTIDLNKMHLLKEIQEQLLKDAFPKYCGGTQIKLRDCEDGRENLRQAFQSLPNERAFIFIDNVLLVEDLKELLPDVLEGLSQGSRILVTARDLSVTEDRGLPRKSYRVEPLADEHGKKILCNDPIKLEQRKDDVNKVLKICGGIPLAQFKKQKYRADNCSVILEALEKGEEIKGEHLSERIFYFVYNNLETSVQEAFLDICSYLYGDRLKRHIEYIVGVNAVAILEEASLITTVPHPYNDYAGLVYYKGEEMLIVHDVILAIRRRSARGTRIVEDEQSLSRAVEDKKVLESTKAVWFDRGANSPRLAESHLSRMSNSLRALSLGHGSVTGCSSNNTFPELRHLHIGKHVPFLPVNSEAFPRLAYYIGPIFKGGFKLPKTLRYLWAVDGYACATSGESNPIHTVQNSSLQELSLYGLEKRPILLEGIHQFIELKVLSLYYWGQMEELPAQVCQLRSLNKLVIDGWNSLKLLPESFSNLTGLTHVDLRHGYMLEGLCASFGKLTSLRYLNLEQCGMLTKLPDSFCQLIAVESLNLARCKKLKILPDNFGQLTALKVMDLRGCERLEELPSSVGELRSLQNLYLTGCSELKELPLSLEDLRSLEIEGSPSVC